MAETVTNTKTHIIKGRTPGTEHTARMTPSPISPCTDRANNNNTLKNSSETLNSLRGVKLTLFQTDNGEKIEDGEVAIAAKATALEAENEALRKQLARHKANIIDHEKSDNLESLKGRAGGSDAGSILSNGCDSVVSRSELLCMKAELVKLKAKLSEKDAEIDDVRKENEKHDSSQKQRIQQMTKNLKNYKSKAEYDALESKVQTLQKGLAVYKEQLLESDEYVSELEKTIDDQLRIWQEEEDTFRAEVTGLREKSVKSAAYESQYVIAQKEVNELKQDLFNANHDVKEIRAMNQKLEENKRTCVEVERAARESTERYEERIRVFQEEKDSLKIEVEKLKEDANDLKERSISIDVENGMEIKKLREQLGHAAFRVQVMRNESPKRKRHGDSNDTSEQSTIARLMKQLKAADTKAETAQEAKRQAEESLISIKSIEIEAESDGKNPSNDIVEALTKKLYDARSRSRRIAVKSEEELSKLRDSESDMRNLAYMHEKQASDLQQRLKKVQHTYSEEAGTRKRIESALRNELSLLRQEKTITASSSLLPKSMKTHSNRIETELEKLVLVTSTLQKSMNLIAKAKKKIAKEMLQKMIKDIDELRSIVSKVEVAAEEDKLQIENAFNVYESAVQSYETQLDGLQNKMKVVKNELSEHLSTRIENTKKTKQVEMDLQAKIRSLTLRLSTLQREYEECKQHVESQDDGSPNSIASSDVLGIINLAPSDEITAVEDFRQPHQTKVNDMPPMRSESKSSIPRPVKKKLSMKLQYGITNSEVEVNLRDGDETRGASMISTRNDLFTSYRSLERSAIEAVAEDSNAKKEEVPQNKMGNIVDTSTGSITSSIRDEKSCNDTSWSSQGSLSGLDASADSHTSQHEPLSNHESVETIEGEYESDEGRMHRDSLKDANHSDTSQANKNNDTSYSSLLETEGLSKILTRSDSDIGIMQTGGEGTNTSRISQAGSCMESIGGDSMIIQHRGEESTSGSIFNTSLACVDLSGVMHARGEDSLEDSVIYNKDVHVESKFDLTTQGHTCDFDYDDTTQRSV
jgi:Lon protease-like protein